MPKYAIFDIDGCCLDSTRRLPLIEKDYPAYVQAWHLDEPIDAGVATYSALMRAGFTGVFITARPVDQEVDTKVQLGLLFEGHNYHLLMAPRWQADHATFKLRTLRSFLKKHQASYSDVLVCFDDNIEVIAAYRNAGFVAYQTAEGWK